ncbi:MAG TPA: amidohydrolase [Clostridiales bacterium]|nr:amidohydrolase [Clostridiales bacterium]
MTTIREQVRAIADEVIEMRRWLHQHAELSFQEVKTSGYIEKKLREMGGDLEITRPTPTSVMAVLKTGRPGPVIALRADIDALPIQEPQGLPYASKNDGVMHACGHDGHAAIQLGTIKVLLQNRDKLRGEVRFLFQHAEEVPPGGAIEMLRAGVMEGVDEVYGLHLTTTLETGRFGICKGVLTSNTDGFTIVVQGKGGHSAMPQLCIDPVPIGGQIIGALQTVVSRRLAPDQTVALSICKVRSGSAYNIIPNTFEMEGSVRTFSRQTREQVKNLIGEIACGIAAANGATADYRYDQGYDAVDNDPELTDIATKVIAETFGPDALTPMNPVMPGEDFGYFSSCCRGFFLELGAANAAKGLTAAHHNPAFAFDEDALALGVEYNVSLLLNRMG